MSVATISDVKHFSRIREIYVVKIITLPPLGSPWQEKYVKYANFVKFISIVFGFGIHALGRNHIVKM